MKRALLTLLLLTACFRGGDVVEPAIVANATTAPATLRIARVAPKVGSVRVETTVSRGGGSDSRKGTRVTVLAVDGFAAVKEKLTYLEATGPQHPLEGKSFILTRIDDQIAVVATDGTLPGDEELVRADNESMGEIDSTVLMVTNRDFAIGTPVRVPAPKILSPGSTITLTLRAFDATSATFDIALRLPDMTSLRGQMTVDRSTGLERSATMTLKVQMGRETRETTFELQATTE
jgi:hypothetical protein